MSEATIGRTFRFESAHFLPKVPEGHRCRNLHGHNYRIEVVLTGPVDERGFVKDFGEIDADVTPLLKQVDHKLLNEVQGLDNPTAEIIARWFLERLPAAARIRVYENDDCWAEASR
jgi:queuosine biosynthesis protein QueD